MASFNKTTFFTSAVLGVLAASHGAVADWSAAVSNDRTRVNINSKALDGKTMFYGGCNTLLGPGLRGSIENYNGNALDRVEDVDRKIIFVIRQPEGSREFPAMVHYYGPDKAWVLGDPPLPVVFIDAFGRGDLLTIRNRQGDKVADFDLKGPEKLLRPCGACVDRQPWRGPR